jgi:8-oxo-dGTP pyrophosphatase MutT (NUDIX family)
LVALDLAFAARRRQEVGRPDVKRALVRSPLRVGQLLFHGTRSPEDFEELRGPAWLSDYRGAVDFFTTWHGNEDGHERVLTYRVIARPKLYIVNTEQEMRWLGDRYDSEYDIQELAERVCDDADGWHIPNNYQPGSDTMLCDPSRFLELVSVEHVGRRRENPTAPPRFYGSSGAGVLVLAADTGRVLFSQRSSHVNEPHTWACWGGKVERGEDPRVAALREFREETLYEGPVARPLALLHVYRSGSFTYRNFLAVVPAEFEPELDWETEAAVWTHLDDAPHPRHFGLEALLESPRARRMLDAALAALSRPRPQTPSPVTRQENPAFRPLPFREVPRDDDEDGVEDVGTDYVFSIDDYLYNVHFDPLTREDGFEVELSIRPGPKGLPRGSWIPNMWGLTGTGNAVPVLATTMAIVRSFVREYAPAMLTFTSKTAERFRTRLYSRFSIPGYQKTETHEQPEWGYPVVRYTFRRSDLV